MEEQWLYCFDCRMSHLHRQIVASTRWRCSNCGATRGHPAELNISEDDAALRLAGSGAEEALKEAR